MEPVDVGDIAGKSLEETMDLLQKHIYVMTTEAWMQHVFKCIMRQDKEHADALHKWWLCCPAQNCSEAFRVITSFVKCVPAVTEFLGAKVHLSRTLEPLGDAQFNVFPVSRVNSGPRPKCFCRRSLWTHLCLQLYYHMVNAEQKRRTDSLMQLSDALRQRYDERPFTDLYIRMRELAEMPPLPQWLQQSHPSIEEQIRRIVTHVWLGWEENPASMSAFSLDFITKLVYLTEVTLQKQSLDFPFDFTIKVCAGATPLKQKQFRHDIARMISSSGIDNVRSLRQRHIATDIVFYICKAYSELLFADVGDDLTRVEAYFIGLLIRSQDNIDLAMPILEPFIYERTIHKLLSRANEYQSANARRDRIFLVVSAAMILLEGVCLKHPQRNVIEVLFWRMTQMIRDFHLDSGVRMLLFRTLSVVLCLPGNRSVIEDMWCLCDKTELHHWADIMGDIDITEASGAPIDAITSAKLKTPCHFAEGDSCPVSLETMIQHFACNDMYNPFTREPITWEQVARTNPSLSWDL